MTIIRRTDPPSIQVDDAETKLDFEVLAKEIAKALEAGTENEDQPQ